MNLRWPSTPYNARFPWYVILWRLLWVIPLLAAQAMFFLVILIFTFSTEQALRAWEIY